MKKSIRLISLALFSLGFKFAYSMDLTPSAIGAGQIPGVLSQLQNLINSIPVTQRRDLSNRFASLPAGGMARVNQFRALLTDAQNAYRAMPPPVAEAIVVPVAEPIVVPVAEAIVPPVDEPIVVHPHLQVEQVDPDTELLEQPQFTTLKQSDLPIDRKKQLAAKLAPILRNTDTVAAYKTTFLPSYFFNLSNATLFAAADMLLQDPVIATWILEYKEKEIIGAQEGDMQSILEYDLLHPQRERNHNRYQQLMMLIKLAYHNSLRDITYALVTSSNNPYAITGENIRALLLPLIPEDERGLFDALIASLPAYVARIFKGNVQIFLNATRLCCKNNIRLIDVLTMDSNSFSTSILRPSLAAGRNLLFVLSAGSEIEIPASTLGVITIGNQYAERVFWKAVKYIFGYNDTNDIERLFTYLDGKELAGNHIGLLKAPISDLQSNSLSKLISIAYVRMFDKEKARVMRFTRRDALPFYMVGGVSGGAYPLLQARYIFRALEKQITIYEDATETEAKEEALETMCIVLGSLIQGFNHCDAGVQGAYTQSITKLMSKENITSISQIARSIYETVATTFFSQIFKFSQPKNGRLDDWRRMDEGMEPEDILFDPSALQPIDEEIMRVKYVQKILNGIYDIPVPVGSYECNDHRNSLNIHLISSRAIPSVGAALNALFENTDTKQWGISKDGVLGTRALSWDRYDYSQKNPSSYSERMSDIQYNQVIRMLFNGALNDTALVLEEALNNPLVEKLIELYLEEKAQKLRSIGLEVQDLTLQKLTEEDEMIKEMKKRIVWDVFRKEGFFQ